MMTIRYYILEGQEPVQCDLQTWAEADRLVCRTTVGDLDVSTVFLGVGPPAIFETMVFDGRHGEIEHEAQRYATWDDALAGHVAIVYRLTTDAEATS